MLDFQTLTRVSSSTIKLQICSSDGNCHVQDMFIWNRDGSPSPRSISPGREGIWGTPPSCRSKPVFSREKHCIVSVGVSLSSAPLSFKELITVKVSEIYNALRSGLGSFPSLLAHLLSRTMIFFFISCFSCSSKANAFLLCLYFSVVSYKCKHSTGTNGERWCYLLSSFSHCLSHNSFLGNSPCPVSNT